MGDIGQRSRFSPRLYLVLTPRMTSSEFRQNFWSKKKSQYIWVRGRPSEKVLSYDCSAISTEKITTSLQNLFEFLWYILSSFCPFAVISRQLSTLFLGILRNTLTIYIISYHVAYTISFSLLCYVYQRLEWFYKLPEYEWRHVWWHAPVLINVSIQRLLLQRLHRFLLFLLHAYRR